MAARALSSCDPVHVPDPSVSEEQASLEQRLATIEFRQRAYAGSLTAAERACLEEVQTTGTAPDRVGALELLVPDAWMREDRARWAELASALLELEPDADLAYGLAIHLSTAGPEHEAAVLRWSEVALAGRAGWTGPTRRKCVAALLKVRASTTLQRLERAVAACGDPACPAADEARVPAEAAAFEWLASARAGGGDERLAERACRAAVRDPARCDR